MTSRDARSAILGGIFAGTTAALLLTSIATLLSLARGGDVWQALKGAAMPFLEDRAIAPGFDALPILIGFGVRLALSVGWAIPFALIVYGLSRSATVVSGVAWGLVVWLGMFYLVLPLAELGWLTSSAPASAALGLNLVYGLVLGAAFAPFQPARKHAPLRPSAA